jgi:hypothetical protein
MFFSLKKQKGAGLESHALRTCYQPKGRTRAYLTPVGGVVRGVITLGFLEFVANQLGNRKDSLN